MLLPLPTAKPEPVAEKALRYLQDHAPAKDESLPLDFLTVNVEYALKPRQLYSWAAAVPEAIWLNNVLPYARYSLIFLELLLQCWLGCIIQRELVASLCAGHRMTSC